MLKKALDNLPQSRPYLIVTAIAVLIFFPTWVRLAQRWLEFEEALTHGLATAVVFLGLLIIHPPRQADDVTQFKPYHFIGAALLIVTTLAWGLLEPVRMDTLTYLLLPIGVTATAWALLGLNRTLSFLPYIILLSLSQPIWADMIPALVDLASIVVGTWVGWFGMTALIEGNSITLPYGRLLIADGCSGFRYLAISIMLAMMTSILNDYRWRGWLITILVAGAIGLLANWVRITILVVVAYETDMQSDMVTDHDMMGWMVFAVFVLPALYFSPVVNRKPPVNSAPKFPVFNKTGAIAIVVALALGPIALTIMQKPASPVSPWKLELPGSRQVTRGDLPLALYLPETLSQSTWRTGDVWMVLAQSQKTTSDEKLVPYLPLMFDTSLWQLQETPHPGLRRYRNIVTRKQIIIGQRFQTGSQSSWSYNKAKLLQIPALLAQQKQFALITMQMECNSGNCDLATKKVQQAMISAELVR